MITLFGDGGISSFIFLIFFFFLYPKLYVWQIIWKLEVELKKLSEYAGKSEAIALRSISENPDKKLKDSVHSFMDFFIVPPVDLDPYGIIGKLDLVINESERKFFYFVDQTAPKKSVEEKANIVMGLKGAMGATQIYKVIRHYVLTIKKTNNLQLAMILQMTLPEIVKIARAQVHATRAMSSGIPIGDSIGPMIAASYKTKQGRELGKDMVVSREKIHGKTVFVAKSKGPGSRLGNPGETVEKLAAREKIDHIITIDASGRLEGEKAGSIAEGVGIAMGGVGVQRSKIEGVAVSRNIPMDAIGIKENAVEAGTPMKKEIYDSLDPAREKVELLIKESKGRKILLMGVGNTSGIGNSKKDLAKVKDLLKKDWERYEKHKKKNKKW